MQLVDLETKNVAARQLGQPVQYDYVIELFAADASGADRERARYFLTVRPR